MSLAFPILMVDVLARSKRGLLVEENVGASENSGDYVQVEGVKENEGHFHAEDVTDTRR